MINLRKITKSYKIWKEDFVVLHELDLNVASGDFVAIMWPSWSWKSTLMNIIWLLDSNDSWEYIFDSKRIDNLKESKKWVIRRKNIWFVFQNYSLIPRINVLEQVKLPLIYAGIWVFEANKRAKEALKRVGLEWKEKSMPNEISGWQKQRVAIARALVISPKIMLADEPTWALDTKTSAEIMELFKELNNEWKTIILITHEKEIAENAKKIIHVRDGKIVTSS